MGNSGTEQRVPAPECYREHFGKRNDSFDSGRTLCIGNRNGVETTPRARDGSVSSCAATLPPMSGERYQVTVTVLPRPGAEPIRVAPGRPFARSRMLTMP